MSAHPLRRLLHVGTEPTSTIWGAVRLMKGVAAISAGLSITIAVAESLAMAGLVTMLTDGTAGLDTAGGYADHVANAWAVIGLSCFSLVLNLAQTTIRERVTNDWELHQRLALIDAFRRADYTTQANYSAGRMSVDGEYIAAGGATIGGIIGLIGFGARAAVFGAVSVAASWQVAAIAVVGGGALVGALRQVSKRTRALNAISAKAYHETAEDIADLVPSARELHALNRWPSASDRLADQLSAIRDQRFSARRMASMVGPVYAMGTLMVGTGVAVWAQHSDGASTSRLAVAGLLLIRSLGAAQSTQVGFQAVNDARPSMDRGLQAIIDLRAAARVTDPVAPTFTAVPRVQVSGASVSYGNDTVVRSLDLDVSGPGGVALIGPSGAGKSTTLLTISGLLKPDSGAVSCDGTDLASLDLAAVTEVVGYLPQDPRLIRASLRENLLRWPRELPDGDLEALLDQIGLMDTVRGFDGGLDAAMGRAAEGLSGGELQRLGLVRLLVADPPVMLLDEPTSALDRRSADRVSELIAASMEDHLVILVTHRPDLLVHCSRFIYMEDGRAVDEGPLDELSERQPFVRGMAQSLAAELSAGAGTSTDADGD